MDKLKNYTSQVGAERTIAQIEKLLSGIGATQVVKKYKDGTASMLAFEIITPQGSMAIKLSANVENVYQVFQRQVKAGKLQRRYASEEWGREQAARTAWRTLKDWLEAQLTLIEIEMVELTEIFLPYIYDPVRDQTVYQIFGNKLPLLKE